MLNKMIKIMTIGVFGFEMIFLGTSIAQQHNKKMRERDEKFRIETTLAWQEKRKQKLENKEEN